MDPPTYGSGMLSNIIFWNQFQKKKINSFSQSTTTHKYNIIIIHHCLVLTTKSMELTDAHKMPIQNAVLIYF